MRTYQQTSHRARAEGWRWYTDARSIVHALSIEHGHCTLTVAGIIAALSPRTQWKQNINATIRTLQGKRPGSIKLFEAKAKRILNGEQPLDVLNGPKERAFYRALCGDDDAIVIDSWMLRASGHHRDQCTRKQYNRIARSLLAAARKLSIPPAILQATIWCETRGKAH